MSQWIISSCWTVSYSRSHDLYFHISSVSSSVFTVQTNHQIHSTFPSSPWYEPAAPRTSSFPPLPSKYVTWVAWLQEKLTSWTLIHYCNSTSRWTPFMKTLRLNSYDIYIFAFDDLTMSLLVNTSERHISWDRHCNQYLSDVCANCLKLSLKADMHILFSLKRL